MSASELETVTAFISYKVVGQTDRTLQREALICPATSASRECVAEPRPAEFEEGGCTPARRIGAMPYAKNGVACRSVGTTCKKAGESSAQISEFSEVDYPERPIVDGWHSCSREKAG